MLDQYLNCSDKEERLKFIDSFASLAESYIPIHLSETLLSLNFDLDEKIAILRGTGSDDLLGLEQFLISGIYYWDQNLASFAIRKWSAQTDHLLWYKFAEIIQSKIVSQRVKYTILDICHAINGKYVIQSILNSEGIGELSHAFHGLLIFRCLQWGIFDSKVDELVKQIILGTEKDLWSDHKAISVAIQWLAKYDQGFMTQLLERSTLGTQWHDTFVAILQYCQFGNHGGFEFSQMRLGESIAEGEYRTVNQWPICILRSSVTIESISEFTRFLYKNRLELHEEYFWELYGGIDKDLIESALKEIEDPDLFLFALKHLKCFLDVPPNSLILRLIEKHLKQTDDPAQFIKLLHPRFRLALQDFDQETESIPLNRLRAVLSEENQFLSGNSKGVKGSDIVAPINVDVSKEDKFRLEYFNLTVKGIESGLTEVDRSNFWSLLAHNWVEPKSDDLNEMSNLARQAPVVYRVCYIQTLARFKGNDEAALKLLDFIRNQDERELKEVVKALGGIATPRALQELVNCITRPNISIPLQLEVCQLLQDHTLSDLEMELRSAINDIDRKKESTPQLREVRDSLIELLGRENNHNQNSSNVDTELTSESLDDLLVERIDSFESLSTEVKRALRTAQFLHLQFEAGKTGYSIDLSPVIDMQYKALELIFRERFEESCFKLVNDGKLQRKLDVIGYARPIPKAMGEFEDYIGSLPVIADIPYFSKFKLRKMLRGICQYRPGKRFTLDGLKAFALFFLCFGRNQCRFGLSKILSLPFPNDADLTAFCKELHVFQDFRNRAAHEGFRPEARNDMEGIWESTSHIISVVIKIRGF